MTPSLNNATTLILLDSLIYMLFLFSILVSTLIFLNQQIEHCFDSFM